MVHNVDVKAQEIGDVAGHIERHDLPLAVGEIFVAAKKTFDEQTTL
jgi:hypothetical protein